VRRKNTRETQNLKTRRKRKKKSNSLSFKGFKKSSKVEKEMPLVSTIQ